MGESLICLERRDTEGGGGIVQEKEVLVLERGDIVQSGFGPVWITCVSILMNPVVFALE